MEATLGEMLRASAARNGDKPLVVCVDRTVTARELDELVSRLAARLVALGIGPGDRVAQHCRPQLASYKVSRAVAFVDDLPKTSTGKILRRVLAESAL